MMKYIYFVSDGKFDYKTLTERIHKINNTIQVKCFTENSLNRIVYEKIISENKDEIFVILDFSNFGNYEIFHKNKFINIEYNLENDIIENDYISKIKKNIISYKSEFIRLNNQALLLCTFFEKNNYNYMISNMFKFLSIKNKQFLSFTKNKTSKTNKIDDIISKMKEMNVL